jgi:predicted Zn-dependent peptidase
MSRDDVAGFFTRWYTPANLVVAAAGAVDHDGLVQAVADRLGDAASGDAPARAAPGATPGEDRFCRRPVELTQVALGWRAPSALDDRRHALALLNHVLGGSPSSRLFQTVREERGLTYSITSEVSQYVDGGALSIHCSTLPRKVASVLGVIEEIVGDMAEHGITDEELARAKSAIRGGVQLGYESMWARMNRLGAAETVRGRVTPLAEHLEMLDEVGPADVRAVAGAVLAVPRTSSLVGPGRP